MNVAIPGHRAQVLAAVGAPLRRKEDIWQHLKNGDALRRSCDVARRLGARQPITGDDNALANAGPVTL